MEVTQLLVVFKVFVEKHGHVIENLHVPVYKMGKILEVSLLRVAFKQIHQLAETNEKVDIIADTFTRAVH